MFASLINRKSLALTAASLVALVAVPAARAETAAAPGPDAPRVEYREFGQGRYIVAVPPRVETPYALTGRTDTRDNQYWERQTVRTIEVGQGRWTVPTNR